MTKNDNPETITADYVEKRYSKQIKYYWDKSKSNKTYYKLSRFWIITLGALVTLISSLSAADFIQENNVWRIIFAIATPVIAATLTLLNGLTQSFHWGATWRDMVVYATRLDKEHDLIMTTPKNKRDYQKELDKLNSIVLEETKSFFQRVLDSEVSPDDEE